MFYFILALLATGAGVYLTWIIVARAFLKVDAPLWDPQAALYLIGGTGLLVLLGSLTKLAKLQGGGAVVARDLGGRPIDPTTSDRLEKRAINVVEEMAIASGIPAPQVWVLDQEMGINAFAAGTEPGNAVVGLTRGCIELLDRSELQGVVGHEFSHILNGDMKLNMRLMGWIFGIIMIGLMGRGMMRVMYYSGGGRSRNREGQNVGLALVVAGLLLIVVGAVGEFCARLIQAAISRQREFLADASAVQFTRNPEGLAGALEKIGRFQEGSKLQSSMAGEASHMFFAGSGLFNWGLATHPPLSVRIKKLVASWEGQISDARGGESSRAGVSSLAAGSQVIGRSEAQDISKGESIRSDLQQSWVAAAHSRTGAQVLIFGLLLGHSENKGDAVHYLSEQLGRTVAEDAVQWQQTLQETHSAHKIALIDIAIPTLRSLTYEQYSIFVQVTERLIASDQQINLFEFMLQRVIAHHLTDEFEPQRVKRTAYKRFAQCADAAEVIVNTVAGVSGDEGAFASVDALFSQVAGRPLVKLPPRKCGLQQLAAALDHLAMASAQVREQLVECCLAAVASDAQLTSTEAEIVRAVAASVGINVPPFLDLEIV